MIRPTICPDLVPWIMNVQYYYPDQNTRMPQCKITTLLANNIEMPTLQPYYHTKSIINWTVLKLKRAHTYHNAQHDFLTSFWV